MIQATEAVRQKLLASAPPHQKQMIQQVLDQISAQVGKNSAKPRNYAEAQRLVADIGQDTELAKSKILEFADANRVAEMVAALSVLSGVPVDQIDRLLRTSNEFGIMVICKASALELDTAYAVAMACNGQLASADAHAFEDFGTQYEELSVSSAQRVIRFWQGRQKIMRHFQSSEA
jgi:hypothetical protein